MVGAYAAAYLFRYVPTVPFVYLLIIFPLFVLLGAGYDYLIIQRIKIRGSIVERMVYSMMITMGMGLLIRDLVYTVTIGIGISIPWMLPSIRISDIIILPGVRTVVLLVITILTIVLSIFFTRTYLGKAMRAMIQNPEGAMIVGVNTRRLELITFGLATAIAGSAGLFYVIITLVTPFSGAALLMPSLCCVILGGLGSLTGSLLAGLLLGVAESITAYYWAPMWSPIVSMVILILFLLFRPSGILGEK
jgi:branched-chain amino acid transport system permease protein